MQTLGAIRTGFGRALHVCGVIAGIITFLVMCLVVTNAILRFAFNAPLSGAFELTEAALPLMIFLALALTQHHGGHIRVVLLTNRMPPRLARAADAIAMALGAAFFAWAAWAAWGFAMKSLAINEHEWGSVRFPIYPLKFAICFGLVLLSVQFLLDALTAALRGPAPASAATPSGEAQS